jgi:hypothetical protein
MRGVADRVHPESGSTGAIRRRSRRLSTFDRHRLCGAGPDGGRGGVRLRRDRTSSRVPAGRGSRDKALEQSPSARHGEDEGAPSGRHQIPVCAPVPAGGRAHRSQATVSRTTMSHCRRTRSCRLRRAPTEGASAIGCLGGMRAASHSPSRPEPRRLPRTGDRRPCTLSQDGAAMLPAR